MAAQAHNCPVCDQPLPFLAYGRGIVHWRGRRLVLSQSGARLLFFLYTRLGDVCTYAEIKDFLGDVCSAGNYRDSLRGLVKKIRKELTLVEAKIFLGVKPDVGYYITFDAPFQKRSYERKK